MPTYLQVITGILFLHVANYATMLAEKCCSLQWHKIQQSRAVAYKNTDYFHTCVHFYAAPLFWGFFDRVNLPYVYYLISSNGGALIKYMF